MKAKLKQIFESFLNAIVVPIAKKAHKTVVSPEQQNIATLTVHGELWRRAIEDSADFVTEHLGTALVFPEKRSIWDYSLTQLKQRSAEGLAIEFGVHSGRSINYFAKALPGMQFFGLDSFVGLQEDWAGNNLPAGSFDRKGKLPSVPKNVTLVKGWFDESLPPLLQEEIKDQHICFIHLDSDTFEAAETVFDLIGERLRKGDLILFDELIGYPNWRNGEYKALCNAEKKFGLKYRYLAFATKQVLIEIL